ncbi:lipopolysaccharide biosynthesis protein [Ornithinimicrobium panacihumi]|uniref:lipopolysaccharide biosynthesis protein n=1 Tax=Ornithinimicrobium panacihumi TaxID=2008449 RepID=UPI003F891228
MSAPRGGRPVVGSGARVPAATGPGRAGGESLLGAGTISLVGSSVAAGTALVLAVVVARSFGPAGTGVFFQLVGWFAVLAGILKLGTNSGLVRGLARSRALGQSQPEGQLLWYAVWPVLLVSTLVAAAVWVWAPGLAARLGPAASGPDMAGAGTAEALRALAPCLVVAAVMSTLHTAVRMMRGVLAFTLLQNVLIPLGRIVAVVAAAWAGWNVLGAVVAWAALLPLWLLLTVCVLWGPVLRDLRGRARRDAGAGGRETLGGFWRFTGGRAVGSAVEVALEWADVLVVAALRPAHEAGIYAVVTRAVRAGQVGDRALRVAASPRIAHLLAVRDSDGAARLHTVATTGLVLLVWPFYLVLIIMGPAVLALFGEGFRAGALPLALLSSAAMLAALAGMLQSILLMAGRSSWQVWTKGTALLLSVVLNLVLVPRLGLLGAATAFCIVVLVDTTAAAVLVHRGVGVELRPRAVLPAALAPLLCFGLPGLLVRSTWGSAPQALVVYVASAAVLYLFVLWRLRERLGLSLLASPAEDGERPRPAVGPSPSAHSAPADVRPTARA